MCNSEFKMQKAKCEMHPPILHFALPILHYEHSPMRLTEVLRRPLITEKTTVIREGERTLVFEVARDANKIDIRRAVESLLGSRVESVRTSLSHGKTKRRGMSVGRRPDWKKAYVKLRAGEKLPEFLQGA
jgi:large subunit ribosomal protein L23